MDERTASAVLFFYETRSLILEVLLLVTPCGANGHDGRYSPF
ncbi:hypothetical protein [Paenibacillus thermotolerans]|nr:MULTISPECIES: hypothetical protein [unclassified Paenibacillus]